MIVKIGARQIVSRIPERGYTWRYVPNERTYLKLEKVTKKDYYTEEEKAKK